MIGATVKSKQSPAKCPTCSGMYRVIRRRPTREYRCGYIAEVHLCPDCHGTGLLTPAPIHSTDHKLAAAGGA